MAPETATERVSLTTSDGVDLEAELRAAGSPWAAAVLLHPHPLQGGDMRASVPSCLFDAFAAAGVAVLRFNFRGTGRSGGTHDEGRSERLDALAALDVLHPLVEGLPLILAGWSFGADVSLAVADDRVAAWLAVAPPLRVVGAADMAAVASDSRPKVLAVPEHDQFCGPRRALDVTKSWASTRVEQVRGADHFLAGRLDRVAALGLELLETLA